MKFLAVITARGGSKGVPKKNIKELGGKPLIAHTIFEAKKSVLIDRIIVSTEDEEIAGIARQWGGEVIKRPVELAGDSVKIEPVLQHALRFLENADGYKCDAVILLSPTCPFRGVDYIHEAIDKFAQGNYDTLISILPILKYSYEIKKDDFLWPNYTERKNRQDGRKPVYVENGAIYIAKSGLVEGGKIFGEKLGYILMDQKSSVNIDEPIDFLIAEEIIKGLPPNAFP